MRRSYRDPLLEIPGIGPRMAGELRDLGFTDPSEIRDQDPDQMYRDICEIRGNKLDRCVLYVFRCAVYYASHDTHDPELLKWWNWKDQKE